MLTQEALNHEFIRLSELLEIAIGELFAAGKDWAIAEDAYRRNRAIAFAGSTAKNKELREAQADSQIAESRLKSFIAEGNKIACLEQVRSLRTQLSALQVIVAARRSELEANNYGQIR